MFMCSCCPADSANVDHLSFAHNLALQGIAGGVAGAVAAVATNPIDIIRTRVQVRAWRHVCL